MFEYKKTLKKGFLFIILSLPFMAIVSFLLSYFFNVPLWLNIFVNVLLGMILCFVFYLISVKIENRKKKKELTDGKPFDPFAD